MYLLGESGSTKTDWLEFDGEGIRSRFSTRGFNPDVWKTHGIEMSMRTELEERLIVQHPSHIFFYGAGLGGAHNRLAMETVINGLFPKAKVEVKHDLLGAARACCGDEPGIACILGTGSNSCLYDGKEIVGRYGGQGYLFGDEGSGSDLGRHLMARILNDEYPAHITKLIEDWQGLKALEIRTQILRASQPNVILARLTRFIKAHIELPEMQELVEWRFRRFLEKTVLRFEEHKHYPIHFIGSVAWVFRDILEEVAAKKEIQTGRWIAQPANALRDYHLNALQGQVTT